MIRVCSMDVRTRNLRQKVERVLLRVTPRAKHENLGANVRRTTSQYQRYEKRDEKLDSRLAKKGRDKICK
jgi:hypothetical protein